MFKANLEAKMLEAETDHEVVASEEVTPEESSPQAVEGVEKPKAEEEPNYKELYEASEAKVQKLSKGIEKMEGRIGKITKRSKETQADFEAREAKMHQELQQKQAELAQYTGIESQQPQNTQQISPEELTQQAEFNVEVRQVVQDPKIVELSNEMGKKGISPFDNPNVVNALRGMRGGLKKKIESILSNEDIAFDLSQARTQDNASYLIGEAVAQYKLTASSEAKPKSKPINEPKAVPTAKAGTNSGKPNKKPNDMNMDEYYANFVNKQKGAI